MRPIAGTARRVPALNPDLGNLYWSCETPEEAAGAAASTIPAGYFGTYEPAIDMEWIKSTWQTAREAVNNKLGPATGETFEDNRWTRAMRDELGINVTYKWVVDGSQAQEKLKLAMASGDLPDVITLEGGQRLVDFQQLAEAGLLVLRCAPKGAVREYRLR